LDGGKVLLVESSPNQTAGGVLGHGPGQADVALWATNIQVYLGQLKLVMQVPSLMA
jgi:hypothetical protein